MHVDVANRLESIMRGGVTNADDNGDSQGKLENHAFFFPSILFIYPFSSGPFAPKVVRLESYLWSSNNLSATMLIASLPLPCC